MKIKFWMVALITIVMYWGFQGFKVVEPEIYPVVSSFEIDHIDHREGSLFVAGTLYKSRDCNFEGLTVYDKAVKPMRLLDVVFLDSPNSQQNRAEGYQSWGEWKLTPYTKNILIQSSHSCATGTVKTILYEGVIW